MNSSVNQNYQYQDAELDLLLKALLDFRQLNFFDYNRASLKRCVTRHLERCQLTHISELIAPAIHDDEFFHSLRHHLTVHVSEMFRDPPLFKRLREEVLPVLKTYPRINIWHMGCATGEEVYSMAILLLEEGLLKRSHLYATDISVETLEQAKRAIYPEDQLKLFENNYRASGGRRQLSNYLSRDYGSIKLHDYLKDSITFSHHDLTKDGRFAEMHLVLCRNVMIYFNKNLQGRVLTLARDSLIHRGWLVIGDKETLRGSPVSGDFDCLDESWKLYQKRLGT